MSNRMWGFQLGNDGVTVSWMENPTEPYHVKPVQVIKTDGKKKRYYDANDLFRELKFGIQDAAKKYHPETWEEEMKKSGWMK